MVGEKYGVVHSCVELSLSEQGFPSLYMFRGGGPQRIPGWLIRSPPKGTGVSVDPEHARLAAIAETVEHYCAMAPADPRLLVRDAFCRLEDLAVPTGQFALLSPRQYRRLPKIEPLTDDKVVDWCWAFSLTNACPVLVPAALVYLAHVGRAPNDVVPEAGGSGFACHVSLTHAVLTGLCEALERDALTIAWQNRLPFTPVDVEGTAAGELCSGPLGESGADFSLFHIPTDSPFPVVLALAWSSHSPPHAAVGVACRPDPVDAAVKALYEATQVLSALRAWRPSRPRRIREFEDHAALYATAQGSQLLWRNLHVATKPTPLAELPTVLPTVGVGSVEGDLEAATAALARLGLEVLVTEVTTPDVAIAGFRVVRVLVPGLVDMAGDARFPRLGGQRLYELPVRIGLTQQPLNEDQVNLLPVPLP